MELCGSILETMATLVIVTDVEGQVVLFNRACEELTGYRFEEIKGAVIWERLIPESELEGVLEVFEELRGGENRGRIENSWLTREGERRQIEWSNSVLKNEGGAVEFVISTGVDITERRAAEERERALLQTKVANQMRLSEEISSGIVDLSADGIITIGSDQRIRQFNRGAEEIFGFSAVEVLGESVNILLPEAARQAHPEQVTGFAGSSIPARRMGERGTIFGRRRNGEIFPAEASISKQKVNGEWLFTAVLRDVTEQQRAAEELQRANRELKRSNDDLEHFAAVASHDLQEPLRKIQAFGDRLESRYAEHLPERGKDYLQRMQSAAKRMSELIQDLLAFSRVTTRAKPFEPVALQAIVERVVEDLEVQIEQAEGEVKIQELPTIDADPMQMQLLFQNLISNGLKFHHPEQSPRVEVWAEELEVEGAPWVKLVVADEGVGFDEKYLDRIFDVFQRLQGRGVYEGTGIGLAIVRKIVERHHGSLTAQSRPGEGAQFIIELPKEQEELASDEESDDGRE